MIVVFVIAVAAVAFYLGGPPVGHWNLCLADDLEIFCRVYKHFRNFASREVQGRLLPVVGGIEK